MTTLSVLCSFSIAAAQDSYPNLAPSDFPELFDKNPYISLSQIEDLKYGIELGAADIKKLRPLNHASLLLIKHFEKLEPTPYDDPSGYCTVGWGHLIRKAKCFSIDFKTFEGGRFKDPLSEEEADDLLSDDTATARSAIRALVNVPLTDDQHGALTSLVFNIGKSNFQGSRLHQLINGKLHAQAAQRFKVFVYSNKKKLEGLVVRRNCESTLYGGGLLLTSSGAFSRKACSSLGVADTSGSFDLVLKEER